MGEIERVHRLGALPSLPRVGDRQRERGRPDTHREPREDSLDLTKVPEEESEGASPVSAGLVEQPYHLDIEA